MQYATVNTAVRGSIRTLSCTNLIAVSCKTYMIIRNFKRKLVATSTYPFKWGYFDQFRPGEPINGTSDISQVI